MADTFKVALDAVVGSHKRQLEEEEKRTKEVSLHLPS